MGVTRYYQVEKAIDYEVLSNGVGFHCCAGKTGVANVTLRFYAPNVVRVHVSPARNERDKKSSIVQTQPPEQADFEVEKSHGSLVLATRDLKITVGMEPWSIEFKDISGHVITKGINGDPRNMFGTQPPHLMGYTCEAGGQDGARKVLKFHESLFLKPDEHIYGLGEKFTRFDKAGQTINMWNREALGSRTESSYKNVPFYVSTAGYGLFVDETTKIAFDIGKTSHVAIGIEVPGDDLDYYFMFGPGLKRIIQTYTDLTGKPPVPPKWSFGLWISTSFMPATEASVLEQARKMRDLEIPADVFHFDCYWLRPNMWNDFVWDKAAFPNPAGLMAELKSMGFRSSIWENPYVSIHSEMFDEGANRGYFLTRSDGSIYLAQFWGDFQPMTAIVDFTNPEAVEWYKEKHRELFAMGADVFKTDFGEEIPADAHFKDGKTGSEMHNLYSLVYNRAVFEVTEEVKGKGVVWGRSGYAGSQRYPTCWAGDTHCTFEDMAAALRGGLSLSLSGFAYWSHDIGGFFGTPTPELFVRWAQLGLFSPHSRCHGITRRDPWLFGERACSIFKEYSRLRYRLIPFIYSYAHEAKETGLPLMRPMVLEYQDDPLTPMLDQQYCLGREILVAPVLREDGLARVYFPEGTWIDFWSDEQIIGPGFIEKEVALETLPIYVRGDSIVPMGPALDYIGEGARPSLELNVYLVGREASFELKDDGFKAVLTARRMEGNQICLTSSNLTESVSVPDCLWRIHNSGEPASVKAGSVVLPELQDGIEPGGVGWHWDEESRILSIGCGIGTEIKVEGRRPTPGGR